MDKIKTTDCYVPVERNVGFSDYWLREYKNERQVSTRLEKKEGVIVLTESEYLADKKKTAEDAFEAGQRYEYEAQFGPVPTNAPYKAAYIKPYYSNPLWL